MGALLARRVALPVTLGFALAVPGSSRAGDPWLAFDVRPTEPYVVATRDRHEAVVDLGVRNREDGRVRVASLAVAYLRGEETLTVTRDASALFRAVGLESDPRLPPGGSETWPGLCLEAPARADRARLTFTLALRRGLTTTRTTQVLEIPLRAPAAPPSLALPVRGWWRVTQGHGCESAHRGGHHGSEFAWDLVAIDDNGRSFGPGYARTHRNADAETFGRPVYAPLAGVVVEASDGVADNDGLEELPHRSILDDVRDPKWSLGNRVVIDAGHGVFVLLGHLQNGSVAVRAGQRVAAGDPIARAGNSGNTKDAHLHVQVMDRADAADPDVAGVPALFADYVEITARGSGLTGEAEMRRVVLGDPPEGAVLLSRGDAASR